MWARSYYILVVSLAARHCGPGGSIHTAGLVPESQATTVDGLTLDHVFLLYPYNGCRSQCRLPKGLWVRWGSGHHFDELIIHHRLHCICVLLKGYSGLTVLLRSASFDSSEPATP